MIATSATFAALVKENCEAFTGPSKSREEMNLTQKEFCDSLQAFFEANRYEEQEQENEETGELETVQVDRFAPYVAETIAARMDKTRVSTASRKLAEMEGRVRAILAAQGLEGEELEAALAKVIG